MILLSTMLHGRPEEVENDLLPGAYSKVGIKKPGIRIPRFYCEYD